MCRWLVRLHTLSRYAAKVISVNDHLDRLETTYSLWTASGDESKDIRKNGVQSLITYNRWNKRTSLSSVALLVRPRVCQETVERRVDSWWKYGS
jgi:hypothetical protein